MSKTILVLGGFGFIGTNIIEEFVKKNKYNLIVFESKHAISKYRGKWPSVKAIEGDFTDVKKLERIFKKHKVDCIFHLISTTIPSSSNENMAHDIESNLIGTIRLLELMKQYNVPKIVFISSGGMVYGVPDSIPINEKSQNHPLCSYGIVKLAIEKYIYLYNKLYGMKYLILRPSNPYGEWHSSKNQGLINVLLEKALKKEVITVWGDGKTVRDYIYIKDMARIIVDLFEKRVENQLINIGSGKGYSINDILKQVNRIAGLVKIRYAKARGFDIPKVILDISRLRAFYDPKYTNINDGISKTYAWVKSKKGKAR